MIRIIAALLRLLERGLSIWQARRYERQRQQHQGNIDEIHADPVDYANAKYGKRVQLPDADPEAVQRGDTDKP